MMTRFFAALRMTAFYMHTGICALVQGDGLRAADSEAKCAEWRDVFLSGEGEKAQEYFVYFKVLRQSQTEKQSSGCVRRFCSRAHKKGPHRITCAAESVKSGFFLHHKLSLPSAVSKAIRCGKVISLHDPDSFR